MILFGRNEHNLKVFNKKMVSTMREQWKHLGATESGKSIGVGCPQFMRGRQERKFWDKVRSRQASERRGVVLTTIYK